MKTANINFNLLKTLNALLIQQNVSKAGMMLSISQSAVSIALKQLREIYQDELLVRGQQGRMELTALAKTLAKPVQEALYHAEAAFTAHMPFTAEQSEDTFHIGMSDYIALVLLPKLMQAISHRAPNIQIVQHAINYLDSSKPFDEFKLDLVIGDFPKAPNNLLTQGLFTDTGVIVADKNHPAFRGKKLTLKQFLTYPQVFVALESHPEENFIANMLRNKGYKINIALMTPHTLIALQALPGTLLMTNTVIKLAEPFLKPLNLSMFPTPYALRKYHAKLYWHPRDNNTPRHQWLRSLIKKLCLNL